MTTPTAYKPYTCRCCGRHLAFTDGSKLVFGEAYTTEPIPIRCAACGRRSYWRPVVKVAPPLCMETLAPA